jgi:hypothetical protein
MRPPATAVLDQLYGELRSHTVRRGRIQVLQQWKQNQVEALIAANIRAGKVQVNHTVIDKVVAQ